MFFVCVFNQLKPLVNKDFYFTFYCFFLCCGGRVITILNTGISTEAGDKVVKPRFFFSAGVKTFLS